MPTTTTTITRPSKTQSQLSKIGRNWGIHARSRIRQYPSLDSEAASRRDISHLPTLASSSSSHNNNDTNHHHHHHQPIIYGWVPTIRELILGSRDDDSTLSCLCGHEDTMIRHIYSFISDELSDRVTLTIPACCVGYLDLEDQICRFPLGRSYNYFEAKEVMKDLPRSSRPFTMTLVDGDKFTQKTTGVEEKKKNLQGYVAFSVCGEITFPEPKDRNVNMLPFIFGDRNSLPEELRCYFDAIECCPYMQEEVGKVGYLTVQEGHVEKDSTQRRGGLHIESPGRGGASSFTPGCEHNWGCGVFYDADVYDGGIYIASTVDDTCVVYDALVDRDVVDHHGGCEHLRRFVGEGTKMKSGQLVWMTDCTPHEAIPMEVEGYRQFFRVVTSQLSNWYSKHSTANPLVAVPDDVNVVDENKFS